MRIIALALLVLGCGNDNAQVNITKTIGSAGGLVDTGSGSSVNVPPGALVMNTNITITKVDVAPPAGRILVGPAFDFGPDGTTFSQPVTITLPFDSSLLPAGTGPSSIVIFTAQRGSTQWTPVATTVASNTVQTSTSHFTVYAPTVTAPSDMGFSNSNPDFSIASCTPSCTPGTSSCGCTETCSTTTITMTCLPTGSSGFNCTCKANGSPLSFTPSVLDCTNLSQLNSAFLQCAG
jgi:hypothetical protein